MTEKARLTVKALSSDIEDSRVLRLHFDRAVTNADRAAICEAINMYHAGIKMDGPISSVHPDDTAVDRFAAAMKAKLAKKRRDGRGGWEDKEACTNAFLSDLMRGHVEKGDPVDVGNFAMMFHQRGEQIGPSTDPEPYAHEYGRSNGDGTFSVVIERGEPRNPSPGWTVRALYERPPSAADNKKPEEIEQDPTDPFYIETHRSPKPWSAGDCDSYMGKVTPLGPDEPSCQ